jgi:hypothetical protein
VQVTSEWASWDGGFARITEVSMAQVQAAIDRVADDVVGRLLPDSNAQVTFKVPREGQVPDAPDDPRLRSLELLNQLNTNWSIGTAEDTYRGLQLRTPTGTAAAGTPT